MEKRISTDAKMEEQELILQRGLITADTFINKNYLIHLEKHPVVPFPGEEVTGKIRLLKVEKIVSDKKENINDKLISVYSALQNVNSTALVIINGKHDGVEFYLGVRSEENVATACRILEKSFLGNFPGSELQMLKNHQIQTVLETAAGSNEGVIRKNISCVTVIPATRDEDKEKFVQGMEKFIDTMQKEKFTAILIARPLEKAELERKKRGYEELATSLSPFTKTSLAYGENYSKAVTQGMFENFSHSVNKSISNTVGTNTSHNTSSNSSASNGGSFSAEGSSVNNNSSSGKSSGFSSGQSWSKAVTSGSAETSGTGTNTSDTQTTGDSRTLTLEYHNKTVEVLTKKIDQQLERIKACEAFGVWECAAYFLADDVQTSVMAANVYKALMLGDGTDAENSFVNVWDVRTCTQTKQVLRYLENGLHPVIQIPPELGYTSQNVTPCTYISGKELPLLMGLPQKSVSGMNVSTMAAFGRNVFSQSKKRENRKIRLGQIHHMGVTEAQSVELDMDSFTAHCFVTGSTGSGKSNTTYCLLDRFLQNDIPFLVIEPAKGEYRSAFASVPGIHLFSTNPRIGQMLKVNPFWFDPQIHVLEHLDSLIEIFNACWEMYAAMPAILKDAIERIYVEKGWDLTNSIYLGKGEAEYPTFKDLMRTLPKVIDESGYSADTKGDYTGALVTRVTSLTNGITGQIFCDCYQIDDRVLFDSNTVVDLSRVGSTETKSLLMGILVLKLSEYRTAHAKQANSGLRHITVLEEAHNLLKSTEEGQEGANVVGKSVEMICNSIAQMRTYGEGFIIVDQSPSAVDIAAIKNTNTKILMRLPEQGDCEAAGNAVGLNPEQIKEMAKLSTGVAVVMQNNWLEAVLTHVDAFSNQYEKACAPVSYEEIRRLRGIVVAELMEQYIVRREMNPAAMEAAICCADASGEKKREMHYCTEFVIRRLSKGRDVDFFCNCLLNLSGAKDLFGILEPLLEEAPQDAEYHYTEKSVRLWENRFVQELEKYLILPEEYRKTLTQYMLHAKKQEKTNARYTQVYTMLYTKE